MLGLGKLRPFWRVWDHQRAAIPVLPEECRLLTSIDEINSPLIRTFATYVRALPKIGDLTSAAAFRPEDLPKLAPSLAIIGVQGEGEDFKVRLLGSNLVSFLG